MDMQELSRIVADFVQVGWMQAVKMYEPPQDAVRLSDVKRWLRMACLDYKTFQRLVKAEAIRPFRKGKGQNSPLYYSKADLKQAFAAAGMGQMMARASMSRAAARKPGDDGEEEE